AIDLGSSGVRAALARPIGRPLAVARLPISATRPAGGPELAREFDQREISDVIARVVRAALRSAGAGAAEIGAVAVTSQREGIALLDQDGSTLYAGPNTDLRGAFQGAAIDDRHAGLIWEKTGHLPSFMLAWSKLAWFRDEAPAVFERAAYVVTLGDWIVHLLTGVLRLERSLGVEAGIVDLRTGNTARDIAGELGLKTIGFPVPVDAGAVVGNVSRAAAKDFGLPEGVPVVAAGPDTQAGLVGMGVSEPGTVGVVAGWSCAVQKVTAKPLFDPERGFWTGRHVIPGRFVLEGNTGVMGGAYDWLARLVSGISGGEPGAAKYAALERAIARAPRGGRSTSAHLGPGLVNLSRSSLRPGGFIFPSPVAFEPPDPGVLGRAAIENFAFAIRANFEGLGKLDPGTAANIGSDRGASSSVGSVGSGGRICFTVGGGMTRNRPFMQILADVMGSPIAMGDPDVSSLGAITLAAAIFPSYGIERSLAARKRLLRTILPDPVAAEEYEALYETWRRRGEVLSQIGL
ncbi:MAG: FGGY-family carbohydrate kinase, partial [Chloroflexi bacterium]|nr:FGGY-family carbohydrate kinase [Chloroflexota bacterium]